MREEGHTFMGEDFIVPNAGTARLKNLSIDPAAKAKTLDWRVHDIAIMPMENLSQMKSGDPSHRSETQA